MVPLSGAPASAITGAVDSNSYALKGSVSLLGALTIPIATTAAVNYPAGPTTNGLPTLNVAGAASAGVITTSAGGDPLADTATAASSVAGLNVAGLIGANAVASSCTTSAPGVAPTVSATVTGLSSTGLNSILGLNLGALPLGAATPNTDVAVTLPGLLGAPATTVGHLYLNQQTIGAATSTPGAVQTAGVNALHLVISLAGVANVDVIVGHSDCTTTVPAAPTVSSVAPVQGPQVGGTTLTINGSNFLGASQVLIDGVSTPFTRVSTTQLTATTLAHVPATVNVQVVNVTGTSAAPTAAQRYTFLPTPTITSISPTSGPSSGGTTVTITGTGFTGATAVTFGNSSATNYTVVNATTITATAPAGTSTQFVQVTAPGGVTANGASDAYTYNSPPTLTTIAPTSGPTTGGTTVSLTGTNFTAASTVTVGGVSQAVTYLSSTSLQITTPAHAAGAVPIVVSTVGGTAGQTFTYQALPVVTGLTPASGSILGGNTLTINGTSGLGSVSGVKIDGTAATITAQSGTSIDVTVPAHLATGPVSVVLTGPGTITTTAGTYTYLLLTLPGASDPAINTVTPGTGPLGGGTSVTLAGTNFTGATAVHFGTALGTGMVVNSDSSITVNAPAATTAGPVAVTVNANGVTSATTLTTIYTYLPVAATLTSISPTSGPAAGGTAVTLTGAGFTPTSTVQLDDSITVPSTYVDPTSMTVTMPPHAGGNVSVDVHTGLLVSNTKTFTYIPATTVTSMTPTSGTTAGGTSVTVSGTNLLAVTNVKIGGIDVTPDPGSTATNLGFTTPAHAAGSTTVVLENTSGLSLSAGNFLYVTPAPAVTTVSPNHGPLAGGNSVTITGTDFGAGTTVTIGGNPATVTSGPTSTSVTVTAPASTAVGATTVVINAPGGSAGGTYTYDALPTVSGISPAQGSENGGTSVTLTGTGFTGATAVKFGATNGTSLNVVSNTSITVTSPVHAVGPVDVTVVTPAGTSATAAADTFTFVADSTAPTISGLTPNLGLVSGGTSVTVTGTGFYGVTSVTFGGTPGTAVSITSDTSLTVTSPSHSAGAFDVRATDGNGTSATVPADQFTYIGLGSPPTVSGLNPVQGPTAGGTLVTITGLGFLASNSVTFGSTTFSIPGVGYTLLSDTAIQVTSPADSVGTVDVIVNSIVNGSSAISAADKFSYVAAPTVTGVSPTTGTTDGGDTVTVTGTGFTNATGVSFGATPGTNVMVNSGTSITVISPAHAAGAVDVRVTGPGGTSAVNNPADEFTFTAPPVPTVSSLTPTSGPTAGGTSVTITGVGFTNATGVNFGATPGTNVTVTSDTNLTVISPAHAAATNLDVTVINTSGPSATVAGDHFSFIAPPAPTVGSLTPTSGPAAGGTSVTITGTNFTNATVVNFGATPGTNLAISSATQLTVTSPAHAAATNLDVTVVGPGGTSATSAADQFTFIAAPTLATISPPSGPTTGGTPVTITGADFAGTTAVQFGGVSGSGLSVSGNTISITTPLRGSAGAVDVVVLGPNGASTPTHTVGVDSFSYTAPATPAVSGISPVSGSTAGGDTVTVTGSGFAGATAVDFGATPGTNVTISSGTSLTVTSPAGAPGSVDVTVVGPGGTSAVVPADAFDYHAPPAITSISAPGGVTAGGTAVTITGSGFNGTTAVKFGSSTAAFTVVNDTSITVTSPAHAAGTVDIRVTDDVGTSPIVVADQFTYAGAPTVTLLLPNSGPLAGGNTVVISGTGFLPGSTVNFGILAGTGVVVNSPTQITVTAPAGIGTSNVQVTTSGGSSDTSGTVDDYSYLAAPTVLGVSPSTGPRAGGTTVTLTGTGFGSATAVQFGTVSVTSFSIDSPTQITVTSPAQVASGAVDVTVITTAGTSATGPLDQFTYGTAPVVGGVAPANGPASGGTSVTISGSGFTGATALSIGGTPVTSFIVVNDSTITFITPPHSAGVTDVKVTTPSGGTSVVSAADNFTFVGAPAVGTVSPSVGAAAGGTAITIRGTGFTGVTAVRFGNTSTTNFTVVDDNTITMTTPAHAAGLIDITLVGPGGTSATSTADQFTYAAADSVPIISSVSPDRGPEAGGTRMTITGFAFTGATGVSFGGVAGTNLTVVSDTSITVTVPAGTGTVNVTVTGPNGTSVASSYDYVPITQLATITSVSPSVGPVAGGTRLTILGSRFDKFTTVTFDGVPGTNLVLGPDDGLSTIAVARIRAAQSFRAAYSNQLTVDSPAHAQGPVTITVTNAAGSVSFVQLFTFIPKLSQSAVSIKVVAKTTTKVTPKGPEYAGIDVTDCSTPTGDGTVKITKDENSCSYSAPAKAGTDSFVITATNVLGDTAKQTVNVTITAADDGGGTGTGENGGGDTNGPPDGNGNGNGGTGTGTDNGNDTNGGDGSGSGTGSNGLAYTGTPSLLIPGLLGGLLLLMAGAGLVVGDRLRNLHESNGTPEPNEGGEATLFAGIGRLGRDNERSDGDTPDDGPDDAA
jgi:hypothetical protein